MLAEVAMSNFFGGGTLRPPSPYRNFAFSHQLKSFKIYSLSQIQPKYLVP